MKIFLIFKTHFDIGFTELAREVTARYGGKMADDVIETYEALQKSGENFIWTMPAWPLEKSLESASNKKRAKLENMIKNGNIVSHALPFTVHTEFMGQEEIRRMFGVCKRLCDRFGLEYPVSAKMTDVPGHTAYLVSALSDAGVKFLHLGCNPGSYPPDVPRIFRWEGADGKSVIAMYNKGGYGTPLIPPEDWQFDVWPALMVSNDNTGPQGADFVKTLREYIREWNADCEVEVGTMDDFYRELAKSDLSKIPVVKKDLADSWIHGVGSYPKEIAALRRNRAKVLAVEKAAEVCFGDSEVVDDITATYDDALLFDEHTWGLNVIVDLANDRKYDKASFLGMLQQPNYQRMEQSWQEQAERVAAACAHTDHAYTTLKKKYFDDVKGQLTIINPHDKPTYYVADQECCRIDPYGVMMVGAKRSVKKGVTVRVNAAETVLENERFSLSIDNLTGLVSALFDRELGANIAENMGRFQYDVCSEQDITDYLRSYAYYFYDWVATAHGRMQYPTDLSHHTYYGILESVKTDGKTAVVTFKNDRYSIEQFGNAEKVVVRYSLTDAFVDVKVSIIGKQKSPVVEGMHFDFGLNLKSPTYRINKVGSVVDPATDIAYGANNLLYCMENWVDATSGDCGVMILSADAPLFSLGQQTMYRFSPKYVARENCNIMFNLCNNMWGTNFPQWMGGDFSYDFKLLPHAGNAQETVDLADSLIRSPLVFEGLLKENVKLQSPLYAQNCDICAVKRCEGGLIVRVRETRGSAQTCSLSGELTKSPCVLVDLFEREGEVFDVSNFSLGAFECKSIKLKDRAK